MTDNQKALDDTPAPRPPTTSEPGSEASEPSPGDNVTDKDKIRDADRAPSDRGHRPDQKDVEPGSDAAADDDTLGVGKEDEPDTGPN